MNKYEIGDRVVVVHRGDSQTFYSYTLEGSVGAIRNIAYQDYRPIYQLDFEYIPPDNHTNIRSGEKLFEYARCAWFAEYCLDPCHEQDVTQDIISDKEFDAIFD